MSYRRRQELRVCTWEWKRADRGASMMKLYITQTITLTSSDGNASERKGEGRAPKPQQPKHDGTQGQEEKER